MKIIDTSLLPDGIYFRILSGPPYLYVFVKVKIVGNNGGDSVDFMYLNPGNFISKGEYEWHYPEDNFFRNEICKLSISKQIFSTSKFNVYTKKGSEMICRR